MANPTRLTDHFDGQEFRNLDGVPAGRSLWDVLRWKLFGGPLPPWPKQTRSDMVAPCLPADVATGSMAATLIGHSTFLLQFAGGVNVLTDPVWSERVSPVSFAGPRRVRPPALAFDDLPPIQTVCVSHGHYDHMDLPTLRRLDERFGSRFIVGLGNKAYLKKKGLRNVVELDWWQYCDLTDKANDGLWNVTFTPAQHWSARGIKRNTTLWGGFFLRCAEETTPRIYFAGDSGLGSHFALIRERLGAPDLALLPIGAYEPRWFMRQQHMNPEDAVQAHLALASKRSIAMHFGTFRLTDESINAPAEALAASLQTHRLSAQDFLVPKFGKTIFVRSRANQSD